MTTSYTPNLRLIQPGVGDAATRNSWGTLENANMTLLESAICGPSAVSLAGLATLTLSTNNGAADQSRPYALIFSGYPTSGACTVTMPNVTKFGIVQNNTGGTVMLTTGAGQNLTIPASTTSFLYYYCDGTNIYAINTGAAGIAGIYEGPSSYGSSTFYAPPGITSMKVRLLGGGGNGSIGPNGTGGGGGAYAELIVPTAYAQEYNVSGGGLNSATFTWQYPVSGISVQATAGSGSTGGSVVVTGTLPAGVKLMSFAGFSGQAGWSAGSVLLGGLGGASGAGGPAGFPGNTAVVSAGSNGTMGGGGGGGGGNGALGGYGGYGFAAAEW